MTIALWLYDYIYITEALQVCYA